MLLIEERFRDFACKPLCDSATRTGEIVALSAGRRAEVDEMVKAEVLHMDPEALAQSGGASHEDRLS
jgi:hypothetical protein